MIQVVGDDGSPSLSARGHRAAAPVEQECDVIQR